MGKSIIGSGLFLIILLSDVAMSDTGVSCAAAGVCNYTDQGNSTTFVGNRGLTLPGGPSIRVGREDRPDPCLVEKGKIDREHATCKYNTSLENGRETARCSTLGTSAASVGFAVRFINASYTIENPTYDKCINQVAAGYTSATAYCDLKYVENKNTARTMLGGRCASSFQ